MSFIKKAFLPSILAGTFALLLSFTEAVMADNAFFDVRVKKVISVDSDINIQPVGVRARGYYGPYNNWAYNPYNGCYYSSNGGCYNTYSDLGNCYWNNTNGIWIYTCP